MVDFVVGEKGGRAYHIGLHFSEVWNMDQPMEWGYKTRSLRGYGGLQIHNARPL